MTNFHNSNNNSAFVTVQPANGEESVALDIEHVTFFCRSWRWGRNCKACKKRSTSSSSSSRRSCTRRKRDGGKSKGEHLVAHSLPKQIFTLFVSIEVIKQWWRIGDRNIDYSAALSYWQWCFTIKGASTVLQKQIFKGFSAFIRKYSWNGLE